MVNEQAAIPLEDELGDVLDKAMLRSGLTAEDLEGRTGVAASRIRDAIDYRPELTPGEVSRLGAALGLNEVGLCALAAGRYPLPGMAAMPFCVRPLRMTYGIGVVNAYLVQESAAAPALLFDAGPGLGALQAEWPPAVGALAAVFVTQGGAEHAGGLCGIVGRHRVVNAFGPGEAREPCCRPMVDGQKAVFGGLEVTAYVTPGSERPHNAYLVRSLALPEGRRLLVTGDLLFAGSAGGTPVCPASLGAHLGRLLRAHPADTLVAPGHGPLTTTGNELEYNPFVTWAGGDGAARA